MLLLAALSLPAAGADFDLLTLQMNPFSRPDSLRAKPPPPPPVVVLPPEEIELEVTATLVSATTPMAMVEGELLAIGDRIEGFKLIAVREGRAIFTRGGKRYTFAIDPPKSE